MMRNQITNFPNSAARLFSGSIAPASGASGNLSGRAYSAWIAIGISVENADRLFGAFFATKSGGANDQT
jgi:hypothetical protein